MPPPTWRGLPGGGRAHQALEASQGDDRHGGAISLAPSPCTSCPPRALPTCADEMVVAFSCKEPWACGPEGRRLRDLLDRLGFSPPLRLPPPQGVPAFDTAP